MGNADMPSLHTYHREVSRDKRSSLSVIADQIPPRSTVLDLGCGTGALGRYSRNAAGITLDGVTLSEHEAALARPFYRTVLVLNLDGTELSQHFAVSSYDFIVCADILEHLAHPEHLLKQLDPLLCGGGRLLVSVPNAAYCGLIAELIEGEFHYRPEGLLDETHLRFFTRRSIIRQLQRTGWRPELIHTITRELWDSEFDPTLECLPPRVRHYLFTRPDAFAYQFVVTACHDPGVEPSVMDQPSLSADGTHAEFVLSLYLRETEGYSQHSMILARGIIGEERQTIAFELPARENIPVGLRLDPADRKGVMSMHSIQLIDSNGNALWTWDGKPGSLATGLHQQIRFDFPERADDTVTLEFTGDDPFFELPVPAKILAEAFHGGGRLVVDLSWPMSADYCAVRPTIDALRAQRDSAIAELAKLRETCVHSSQVPADGAAAPITETGSGVGHESRKLVGAFGRWLRKWFGNR